MTVRTLFSAIVSGVLLCSPWLTRSAISVQGFGIWANPNSPNVYYVENLSSGTGPGSLRKALSDAADNGGGTIRFDPPGLPAVGGVIDFSAASWGGLEGLEIPSNTTIAGETAADISGKPPGITIYGTRTRVGKNDGTPVSDVIVRHVRFRDKDRDVGINPNPGIDCFEIFKATNVAVHNCSMAWGNDGTLDIAESSFVTVEYCIIAETLKDHSRAMLVRGPTNTTGFITIHHNLFISNDRRNCQFSDLGLTNGEFHNNVVYNFGFDGTRVEPAPTKANIIGNVYKKGPSTLFTEYENAIRNMGDDTTAYKEDNMVLVPLGTSGEFSEPPEDSKVAEDSGMIPTAPDVALHDIMTNELVGPNGPKDMIDARLINEAWNSTGSIKWDPLPAEVQYLKDGSQ